MILEKDICMNCFLAQKCNPCPQFLLNFSPRSNSSNASSSSSSSIVSASSNSVSYVPKEKTTLREEESGSGEENEEFFTCPTQPSSEATIPEAANAALGYQMEEVEDEFAGD